MPPKPKRKRRGGTSANGIMYVRAAKPNGVWTWDMAGLEPERPTDARLAAGNSKPLPGLGHTHESRPVIGWLSLEASPDVHRGARLLRQH